MNTRAAAWRLLQEAVAAHGQGRLSDGLALCRQAIDLDPGLVQAHTALGLLLIEAGHQDAAAQPLRQAVTLAPYEPAARLHLARLLWDRQDLSGAEAEYRALLDIDPGNADACNGLGMVLQRMDRPEEALVHYERAVALDPEFAEAHKNVATLRMQAGDMQGAEAAGRRALELAPGMVEARNNLGLALKYMSRRDEAEAEFRRCLNDRPDHADARFNLGLLVLSRGRLAEGFSHYEARWRASVFHSVRRQFRLPVWTGGSLQGRHILVWGEQGVGDEILFAGLVPDLQRQGARVVLECDPRLTGLFARALPGVEVVARTDPPAARLYAADLHLQCPSGSLAGHLRLDLASFPSQGLRLSPTPDRLAAWMDRLRKLGPGLRVGICWTSSLVTDQRAGAYLPLGDWAPLLTLPGVRIVNLQYNQEAVEAEIRNVEASTGASLARWPDIDLMQDLEEMAALIAGLDLVVTAPTSVGEMAAALGVPTWRVTPPGDWTQLGTAVRPWYPCMQVFTRLSGEDGRGQMIRVARHLSMLAPTLAPPSPVLVPAAAPALADAARLFQDDRLDEAEILCRSLLESRPETADALHLLGRIRLRSGRADEAATLIRQAIARNPSHHEYLHSLGRCLEDQGHHADARSCYRRALELMPGYPPAQLDLDRMERIAATVR